MKSVIIIEGNIGAGKSSLATELAAELGQGTLLLLEPDEVGNLNPYLADFYGGKERWGFTMQVHLLARRYRQQLHAQAHVMSDAGHAILDRSFYGDVCFAELLHGAKLMSDRELETYRLLYEAMSAHVLLPSVCIRLLTSPESSYKRIEKRYNTRRGRASEQVIDLAYLKALDEKIGHVTELLQEQGVRVIDLPWDAERETTEQRSATVSGLASRIRDGGMRRPGDVFTRHHRRLT